MGLRGPPPKPESVKKAQGTYRKHRDKSADAQPAESGAPPRPRMAKDAVAIWGATVPGLLERGTLSPTDGAILEAFCRTLATYRACMGEGEKMRFVAGAVNPALVEARLILPQLRGYATDLGLSYAARSRTKAPSKPSEPDADEAFIFGGGLKSIPGGKIGTTDPAPST